MRPVADTISKIEHPTGSVGMRRCKCCWNMANQNSSLL